MNRNKKIAGFTLIEMLLVVAVLAVVGTMIVSQFGDTEKQAKQVAAIHNPKMLEQVVNDFKSLYSVYPMQWHTGLNTTGTTIKSVEGLGLQTALNMAGTATAGEIIPTASLINDFDKGYQVATPGANVKTLTVGQARALRENGIHKLMGSGYTPKGDATSVADYVDVAGGAAAPKVWVLTGGAGLFRGGSAGATYKLGTIPVTIDGVTLAEKTAFEPTAAVVLVACTKELNWKSVMKGDPDADGFGEFVKNSQIELPEAPRDPNAKSASAFPYYWAAFYVSPDQIGGAGFSAQLLGILDGELNPVQG